MSQECPFVHRSATWKGLGVLYVAGLPCENENSQASGVCMCEKHCRGSLEEQKLLPVSTGLLWVSTEEDFLCSV